MSDFVEYMGTTVGCSADKAMMCGALVLVVVLVLIYYFFFHKKGAEAYGPNLSLLGVKETINVGNIGNQGYFGGNRPRWHM